MAANLTSKRLPDIEKYCAQCGTRLARKRFSSGVLESNLAFRRRKFCDQKCMAADFDARPSRSIDWSTTHWHSRKMVSPGPCELCGRRDASDVHHLNGDHTDNSRANLSRVCRGCHTKAHRVRRSCEVCGKPVKGLGYCEKHYQRFKKYGDPLMFKRNQHTPLVRLPD